MKPSKNDVLTRIFKDYTCSDCEDFCNIASLISSNDNDVAKQLDFAVSEPEKYLKENAQQFWERNIDFEDYDSADEFEPEELLFLAMTNELEEHGYAFEVDWKCELEDFLWALEQIKTYDLISDVIPELELSEDGDVEEWGEKINNALEGKAMIGVIGINSDSYPLIIVSAETLEKIQGLAKKKGQIIEDL